LKNKINQENDKKNNNQNKKDQNWIQKLNQMKCWESKLKSINKSRKG